MASEDGDSLESLLNRATNPANRDEDWELLMAFCDQVNKELEGPQIAVRLLAHKIQSPQEKEALYALTALEACVKNCKKRFHQEIGKFRFLNEVIKVVSPKYLGNHTTERVKSRCIEILYSWSQCLKHEPKINEAYQMLKRQGIVKQDPTHTDKTFEGPVAERPKNTVFDDEDKSKLLSRLLKSKHPEDLQAANRLIKNMVKQDAERMEKKSRRQTELETVGNNVKLLTEMLEHFYPNSTSAADKDLMKELYENLEKERPNLFRLASDTDEKDNEGINAILKANDEVLKVMTRYKKMVDSEDNGLLLDTGASGGKKDADLVDLLDSSSTAPSSSPHTQNDHNSSASILDDQLMVLDSMLLHDLQSLADGSAAPGDGTNSLNELGEIFGSTTTTNTASATSASAIDSDLFGLKTSGYSGTASLGSLGSSPGNSGFSSFMSAAAASAQTAGPTQTTPFSVVQPTAPIPNLGTMSPGTMTPTHTASGVLLKPKPIGGQNQAVITGILTASQSQISPATGTVFTPVSNSGVTAPTQKSALDDLDALGQSLLQSSLSPSTRQTPANNAAAKIALNQMQKPASPTPGSGDPWTQPSSPALKALSHSQAGPMGSPIATPTGSAHASPKRTPVQGGPAKTVEVQSLSDLFVPLESVKPGTVEPLTAYDKNGMKIVIHFGKDTPRPDVTVMVVSSMSTNTSPVKNFTFQAAVPKMMRVKLQPPSATDLPAYNPILPTAAITQVMLLANPQKERIRLKFKISYNVDADTVTDVGEVVNFPVQ